MIKVLLSLMFLPAVAAFAWETFLLFLKIIREFRITLPFIGGFFAYLPFHGHMSNESRIYVWAHELSHALAAVLNGVRVNRIKVRKRSGYVSLEKTNVFIMLSPYFLPLYVILAAILYALVSAFADISAYRWIFVFIIGFFLSFHAANTIEIVFFGPLQSDIKKAGGRVFSFTLIAAANCAVLLVIVKILYPGIFTFGDFWRGFYASLTSILLFAGEIINRAYNTAKIYIG